ncbi:TELO2-interacting protein 1 homolog [Chrysoperla carnea]|uniref:TELO2-interacting protein 1 homolog n=1 Tax=Chrysoperla carnea TaxID=189513 RepID=UPI001D07ED33|nr:TELO2-interacting protein 1 homolog [Chrysoperla carnea]
MDYVNYLLSSLITIVEFDVIDLSLLEDYSFKDFNDVSKLGAPWKKFRHLNEEAHEKICAACHVIGNQITNNGAETIINMLLDRFQTIHEQRKEIVFLLNTIASTPIENSTTNIEYKLEIIENILEVYIDTDHWYLPIKSDSDCESIKEIKSNVIQVCLMTEGIGLAAQALGSSFDRFMRQTLYILLERAGSTQTYVSLAGMNSINMIKDALNFTNVTSLLVNNSDYLRYHIIKKLRYVECNSEVLDVLGFIMRYSTIGILPCMEEIISDALVQSLDKIQYKNWIPFIRLFQIFVKTVAQWQEKDRNLKILLSTSNETGTNDTYDAAKMNQLQSENILTQVDGLREIVNEYDEIDEEFKKREQNMTTTEMILEDYKEEQQKLQELKEMDEIDSNIDENNKPKPPLEIQLTNDIMKRCVHFLPSKDENLKILTLDVLTIGVGVLREWEDIILPMVHLIWSPLIGRFKEISNPLIVDRSVILLHTMIQFTDTFLGRRTLPQLRILIKYLKDLAPDSLLKDSKSAYRYTQQYKLQLTLLKYIPEIVKNLKITDVVLLNEIFSSGIPYLSNRQPKPLQENCIRFYKICNEIDKNLITQIIFNDKSIIESKEYKLNLKILKSFIEVV